MSFFKKIFGKEEEKPPSPTTPAPSTPATRTSTSNNNTSSSTSVTAASHLSSAQLNQHNNNQQQQQQQQHLHHSSHTPIVLGPSTESIDPVPLTFSSKCMLLGTTAANSRSNQFRAVAFALQRMNARQQQDYIQLFDVKALNSSQQGSSVKPFGSSAVIDTFKLPNAESASANSPAGSGVRCIKWDSRNFLLAAGGAGGFPNNLVVVNTRTKAISSLNGHFSSVNAVCWFSAIYCADYLVSASDDSTHAIRIFDSQSKKCISSFSPPSITTGVKALALSPCENYIACAGDKQIFLLLRSQQFKLEVKHKLSPSSPISSNVSTLLFSHSGGLLFSGEQFAVRVWSTSTPLFGTQLGVIENKNATYGVAGICAVAPSGLVFVRHLDKKIHLYMPSSPDGSVWDETGLTFSPPAHVGNCILDHSGIYFFCTTMSAKEIRCYDLMSNCADVGRLAVSAAVNDLAINANQQQIAIARSDSKIELVSVRSLPVPCGRVAAGIEGKITNIDYDSVENNKLTYTNHLGASKSLSFSSSVLIPAPTTIAASSEQKMLEQRLQEKAKKEAERQHADPNNNSATNLSGMPTPINSLNDNNNNTGSSSSCSSCSSMKSQLNAYKRQVEEMMKQLEEKQTSIESVNLELAIQTSLAQNATASGNDAVANERKKAEAAEAKRQELAQELKRVREQNALLSARVTKVVESEMKHFEKVFYLPEPEEEEEKKENNKVSSSTTAATAAAGGGGGGGNNSSEGNAREDNFEALLATSSISSKELFSLPSSCKKSLSSLFSAYTSSISYSSSNNPAGLERTIDLVCKIQSKIRTTELLLRNKINILEDEAQRAETNFLGAVEKIRENLDDKELQEDRNVLAFDFIAAQNKFKDCFTEEISGKHKLDRTLEQVGDELFAFLLSRQSPLIAASPGMGSPTSTSTAASPTTNVTSAASGGGFSAASSSSSKPQTPAVTTSVHDIVTSKQGNINSSRRLKSLFDIDTSSGDDDDDNEIDDENQYEAAHHESESNLFKSNNNNNSKKKTQTKEESSSSSPTTKAQSILQELQKSSSSSNNNSRAQSTSFQEGEGRQDSLPSESSFSSSSFVFVDDEIFDFASIVKKALTEIDVIVSAKTLSNSSSSSSSKRGLTLASKVTAISRLVEEMAHATQQACFSMVLKLRALDSSCQRLTVFCARVDDAVENFARLESENEACAEELEEFEIQQVRLKRKKGISETEREEEGKKIKLAEIATRRKQGKTIAQLSRFIAFFPEKQEDLKSILNDAIESDGLISNDVAFDCFEILQQLATAGDGARHDVFAAKLIESGKKYCLKSYKLDEKFYREVRTMSRIEHRYILPMSFAFVDHSNVSSPGAELASRAFIASPYVEGKTLDKWIALHPTKHVQHIRVFACILEALQHLASVQIAHSDIKPLNILMNSDAEDSVPQLIDFDAAKTIRELGATIQATASATRVSGTFKYFSPEVHDFMNQPGNQALAEKITVKTDIFSLAICILESRYPDELITPGVSLVPRLADNKTDFDKFSKDERELLRHMLEVDVEKRFSARECLESQAMNLGAASAALSKQMQLQQMELERSSQLKLPVYWKSSISSVTAIRVPIQSDSQLFKNIAKAFEQTIIPGTLGYGRDVRPGHKAYTNLKVRQVFRLENPDLFKKYAVAREAIAHRSQHKALQPPLPSGLEWAENELQLRADVNEKILFHGTKHALLPIIERDGFDSRVCSTAGLFGSALYLGCNSSKSDQYVDENSSKLCPMFLCRVTMGSPAICLKAFNNIRRPNCLTCWESQKKQTNIQINGACPADHVLADSNYALTKKDRNDAYLSFAREICIYASDQLYPEFLCLYERV